MLILSSFPASPPDPAPTWHPSVGRRENPPYPASPSRDPPHASAALARRDAGLQVGEAWVIDCSSRRVRPPDAHSTHDLSQGGALREWIVPRTRTYVVFNLLDLDGTDERRPHDRLLAACAPDHEHLPSSLRHS